MVNGQLNVNNETKAMRGNQAVQKTVQNTGSKHSKKK